MSPMSRIARYATLLIVLAAGLLVACNGDESEERTAAEAAERFVNEFPPLNERISDLRADLRQRVRRAGQRSPQRLARNLGNAADEFAELRQEVESLPVPATLAPQQKVVIEAIRNVRRALERMSRVASVNRPPPALGNARIALMEASRELGRARSTFADGMAAAGSSG